MSDKYKYKQNDRIYFEMGGPELPRGYGKISGCASDELPALGRQWIIELESPIGDGQFYSFKCITIFDCMIKSPPDAPSVSL